MSAEKTQTPAPAPAAATPTIVVTMTAAPGDEESETAAQAAAACDGDGRDEQGNAKNKKEVHSSFLKLHELVLEKSATDSARVKRGSMLRRMSSVTWWASGRWGPDGASSTPRSVSASAASALANKSNSDSEKALSSFMSLAGEPITWVEAREIWRNMYCKVPPFTEIWRRQCVHNVLSEEQDDDDALPAVHDEWMDDDATAGIDFSGRSRYRERPDDEERASSAQAEAMYTKLEDLNPRDLTPTRSQASAIARSIKETYSIRLRSDKSELKFVLISLSLLWVVVCALSIAGALSPHHEKSGALNGAVFVEATVIFFAEVIWECLLSLLVIKTNIKINYTRKLGHLMKVPKYFAADLLPFYKSTAVSLTTSLAFNQTLFCLIYYRVCREAIPAFAFIFLSQDRREDRPDTLTFQVTEDIMRFAVYFPFKLLVADAVGSPALVFVPIAVNVIGDGLAEPVGVRFGRHKYKTTALYYKGKFWNGEFTRSVEGSMCVFVTTIAVVAFNKASFSAAQFGLTMGVLPLLMTVAEAKAPHTNDGPFMALIGCGFLAAVFFWIP